MLLANYGSDSDSDGEVETTPVAGPSKTANAATAATASAPSSGPVKKKRGPVKITLDLPKGSSSAHEAHENDRSGSDVDEEDDRGIKKPRLGTALKGKGSSALLGMLPPPKRKTLAKPSNGSSLAVNKSMSVKPPPPPGMEDLADLRDEGGEDAIGGPGTSGLLLPSSIARSKAKAKEVDPEPEVDLFGISAAPSRPSQAAKDSALPVPTAIVSAPSVPDFVPPEPIPNDPYPGYYQLPSGQWAAYDPDYYHSFFNSTAEEEEVDDGRVGKHWDEYERKGADLVDVDVSKGLQMARDEEERRAKLKKPNMPGEEFEYKAIGQTKGLAAQRHQLSSLLNTAYTQREELQDRIQQNKKNMRVASTKYGF